MVNLFGLELQRLSFNCQLGEVKQILFESKAMGVEILPLTELIDHPVMAYSEADRLNRSDMGTEPTTEAS